MIDMKTALLPHQEAAYEKLRRLRVGALFMAMGTGKTRTTLELIKYRLNRNTIKHVLWLCPCSVRQNLKDDIIKHADGAMAYIAIHGIESLSGSVRLYEALERYVTASETMIVVDESNLVKNFKAKRTKRIIELAKHCRYRLILNGTPVTRNASDLFAQWYILDWRILGYRSFYGFAENHLEYDKYGNVRRCLNTDYLAEKIAPYCYQVSKEECLTLPEKQYQRYGCYLADKQEEHYEKVVDYMLDRIDNLRPETIYRLFSAAQAVISGQWVSERKGHMHTKPMFSNPLENPRIQKLLEIIEGIENEKAIIFCRYTHEIKTILKILPNSVPFYGEISNKERLKSLERFTGNAQYLVANKMCAGYGLNLQHCRNIVFYSNDWNWGTRAQAEDRVHRLGQMDNVRIYDLYAYGTLDMKIMRCLDKKERLNNEIKHEIKNANNIKCIKGTFRQWLRGEQ